MPLNPKIEKKIDTLYRNTKQLPLLAILGVIVPIILIIAGPLGILYWCWRRDLLRDVDGGNIVLDASPPPLPSTAKAAELSTSAKLKFIREHPHSLLVPVYLLGAYAVLLGVIIAVAVISAPKA
jgi:hypothetical protein